MCHIHTILYHTYNEDDGDGDDGDGDGDDDKYFKINWVRSVTGTPEEGTEVCPALGRRAWQAVASAQRSFQLFSIRLVFNLVSVPRGDAPD